MPRLPSSALCPLPGVNFSCYSHSKLLQKTLTNTLTALCTWLFSQPAGPEEARARGLLGRGSEGAGAQLGHVTVTGAGHTVSSEQRPHELSWFFLCLLVYFGLLWKAKWGFLR